VELIQTISQAVIALSLLTLAIVLCLLLRALYRGIRRLTSLLEEWQQQLRPLIGEVSETVRRANRVADRALDEVEGFTDSVSGIRQRTSRLTALVEILEEQLENSAVRLVSLVGGLASFMRRGKRAQKTRPARLPRTEQEQEDE
jgi:uncharacterized protein YoxC